MANRDPRPHSRMAGVSRPRSILVSASKCCRMAVEGDVIAALLCCMRLFYFVPGQGEVEIPPAIYSQREVPDLLILHIPGSDISEFCSGRPRFSDACALPTRRFCLVVLPTPDSIIPGWNDESVRRADFPADQTQEFYLTMHELAHCKGWRHDITKIGE